MQIVKSTLSKFRKFSLLALLTICALLAMQNPASAYDLVDYTAGVVTFTPENLVVPLIAVMIGAITAGLGMFIIYRGVGIAKRFVR